MTHVCLCWQKQTITRQGKCRWRQTKAKGETTWWQSWNLLCRFWYLMFLVAITGVCNVTILDETHLPPLLPRKPKAAVLATPLTSSWGDRYASKLSFLISRYTHHCALSQLSRFSNLVHNYYTWSQISSFSSKICKLEWWYIGLGTGSICNIIVIISFVKPYNEEEMKDE